MAQDPFTRPVPTLAEQTAQTARDVDEVRGNPGRYFRPGTPSSLRERVAQARADYYEQAIGHGELTVPEVQEAEAYGRVRAYDEVLAMIDETG